MSHIIKSGIVQCDGALERIMLHLLDSHSIDHRITFDGRLMVWESATQLIDGISIDVSRWIDISTWSRQQLLNWLGY